MRGRAGPISSMANMPRFPLVAPAARLIPTLLMTLCLFSSLAEAQEAWQEAAPAATGPGSIVRETSFQARCSKAVAINDRSAVGIAVLGDAEFAAISQRNRGSV